MTFIDFWMDYRGRLSFPTPDGLEVTADHIAVVDDAMRSDVVALGIDASRVRITGVPLLDELWSNTTDVTPAKESSFLFLSQPIEELWGKPTSADNPFGYSEHTILRALAPVIKALDADLIIRPHPRENVASLTSFVAGLDCKRTIDQQTPLKEAVQGAQIVLGMNTIALVEAVLMGKKTVSLQIGARKVLYLPTIRAGATRLVLHQEDLLGVLTETLHDTRPIGHPRGEGWSVGATDRLIHLVESVST